MRHEAAKKRRKTGCCSAHFQTFRVVVPHIFLCFFIFIFSVLNMLRLLVAPHLHPRGVYIQCRPTTFRTQLLSTRLLVRFCVRWYLLAFSESPLDGGVKGSWPKRVLL